MWVAAVNVGNIICDTCPFSNGGTRSCVDVVVKKTGNMSCASYEEIAKQLLTDIEVNRVILGEDID